MYISIHSLCSMLCWCTFGSITASSLFEYSVTSLAHLPLWAVLPIPLCSVSQAPSDWIGSVSAQPFSDLSRDVQKDSSLGSSWATQGHSQSCPEATPLKSWLCASVRCPAERWTVAPIWGEELSGAGFHSGCLCTLLHSSFPQSWLVSQFLLLKNIPTAWCCHHHASL